jgi:hypothetical protein
MSATSQRKAKCTTTGDASDADLERRRRGQNAPRAVRRLPTAMAASGNPWPSAGRSDGYRQGGGSVPLER